MSNATHVPAQGQPGNAIQLRSDPRAMQFKSIFEGDKFQNSLRTVLPRHIDPQRLIRVTLSAFQTQPKLLECSPESVLLSLMRAASMGLEPDGGPLGQGYLVPFWNGKERRLDCQFIPGYRGLIKLARNSGEVADVWAEVVYDADMQAPGKFSYELGLEPKLQHVRNDEVKEAGELRYAYAVARFRDGERKFVVMNRREVEKVRAASASKAKDGSIVGPWKDWPAEMWKKTAVRRLCKMLPLSVEDQTRLAAEDHESATVASAINFDLPAISTTSQQAIEQQSEQQQQESVDEHASTSAQREPGDDIDPLDEEIAALATLNSVGDVKARQHEIVGALTLNADEQAKWNAACEARLTAIRANRGQQKLMETAPHA